MIETTRSHEETRPKSVIRRLLEVGYVGNRRGVCELASDTDVDHGFRRDEERLEETRSTLTCRLPGRTCHLEEIIAEGDGVAAFYRLTGTNPSEQKTIRAVGLFSMRGGKVLEHWGFTDTFF